MLDQFARSSGHERLQLFSIVTSAVILTFSNHRFSECCCGSQKSPLYVLRHHRHHVCPLSLGCQNLAVVPAILKRRNCAISLRPWLSSTSLKKGSNINHFGSSWIFVCLPDFPREVLTFWHVVRFIHFSSPVGDGSAFLSDPNSHPLPASSSLFPPPLTGGTVIDRVFE